HRRRERKERAMNDDYGYNRHDWTDMPERCELWMRDEQNRENRAAGPLSRRELLRRLGGATLTLTLSGMLSRPASAQNLSRMQRLLTDGRQGRVKPLDSAPNLSSLQLPLWGDGSSFDQPPYYQTIQAGRRLSVNKTAQSADIDGDGQDELVARG